MKIYLNVIYGGKGSRERVYVNRVGAKKLPGWYTGGRPAETVDMVDADSFVEGVEKLADRANAETRRRMTDGLIVSRMVVNKRAADGLDISPFDQ